jgi:hypothetical protein
MEMFSSFFSKVLIQASDDDLMTSDELRLPLVMTSGDGL